MNPQRLQPLVVVLSILVSLLAYGTGHLWRHAGSATALAATAACVVGVLVASAIAHRGSAHTSERVLSDED